MEVKELNLLESLLKQFYERMIDGKITDAKGTLNFVFKTFGELRALIPAIIQSLEEDKAKQLNDSWQALQTAIIAFKILTDKELNITEQAFAEDTETWKELLSGIFKEKVDMLCSLLNAIHIIAKSPIKPEQKVPPFEYDSKYTKLKERHNLYSQHIEEINRTELKILRYVGESLRNNGRIIEIQGLSDVIQTGNYRGNFHADLPKPMGDHRIVYSYDGKRVTFKVIGKHKELGIG